MELEMLFINKKDNNRVELSDVKQLFEHIFDYSEDRFQFEGFNISCEIMQTFQKKFVSANLNIDGESAIKASILSKCKQKVQNGSHRRNYHIIISYDESSDYYCNKLFKWLSRYERKLRHFIYLTIVNAFGNKWVRDTIEKAKDLEERIKKNYSKNREKMIEDALEEFEFSNYDTFLFSSYPDVDPKIILDKILEYKSEGKLKEEQIIKMLQAGKEKSLWERYFEFTEINDFKNNIEEIREIRNSVMHHKQISAEDFKSYKSLLRKSINTLSKAISKVKTESYYEARFSDVFISFKNVTNSMHTLKKPIIELQTMMQNLSKSFVEQFSSLDNERFEAMRNIINLSTDYEKTSSIGKRFGEAMKLSFHMDTTSNPLFNKEFLNAFLPNQSLLESLIKPWNNFEAFSSATMFMNLEEKYDSEKEDLSVNDTENDDEM